ncbi:MAG: FtsX-like permease family protein [Clostridia bacterium]|nr:FtsX-like permease family protein [Clostridia bacterium]
MVMKAGVKTTIRLFKRHVVRLITIIAIILVSVGFMAGIGEVEKTMRLAVNERYIDSNLSDVYLKSTNPYGFTQEEISHIEQRFGADNTEKSFSYEYEEDGEVFRVYSYDLQASLINKLELLEGRFPIAADEIVAERETELFPRYEVGEKVTLQGKTYTVCGIVENPLLSLKKDERSFMFSNAYLRNVFYIQTDNLPMINDIHALLKNRDLFDAYNAEYETEIREMKAELETELGKENVIVLSLYENAGLYSIVAYAEKVGLIAVAFVVFFLLVTLLVVYSTMSRLFEEERSQIACQKTLGYGDKQTIARYVFFVAVGILIGGALALPVGYGMLRVIYFAFTSHYSMPAFPSGIRFGYYLFSFAVIFVFNTLLAFISGIRNVKGSPALLLTPKAPKSGKKVLLERIPLLWNRLSFKYKSTLRNVLLFKSRFLMTVVSVIGSTVLVFAGMGLLDCARLRENAFAISAVAILVLVFSAVLCALVVYNLTNINVSERKREIATLMVLGYHDKEVTGYIYREIYIMSLIGALLGVPLGVAFLDIVFGLIDFGTLSDINWWTYVLTPLLTMLFSFISTRLLRKNIVKTDMNASLKSLE